jgi:hypothetical protein
MSESPMDAKPESAEYGRAKYERDGYIFPLTAMTPERAGEYRQQFESVETAHAQDAVTSRILKQCPGTVLPFISEITRLSSVIEPVKAILGDDLLVIGANFFIKEPATPAFVSWHQDLTYWGYDDVREVTAWVALSPATSQSGCMRFVPRSHQLEIVEHRDTFEEANLLSRGQMATVEVNEEDAVDVILRPGEISLHHGRLLHASRPNASTDRRIGLAIRYVAPSMRQVNGLTPSAHLVAGEDRHGHFRLLEPPASVLAESDVENALGAISVQERIGYEGAADRGRRIT